MFSALKPMLEAPTLGETDGVQLLIKMTDRAVRDKVGELFVTQMQNASRVKGTFFEKVAAPSEGVPAGKDAWIGQVAAGLVALSLAQTSGNGFNTTTNFQGAEQFLNQQLAPGNTTFLEIATHNYKAMFPGYCGADGVTMFAFLAHGQSNAAGWGTALANALTTPAYINQEMMKLSSAVAPTDWYQVFYLNVYKVSVLNANEVDRVVNKWKEVLGDVAVSTASAWTIYDRMLASSYNVSTFMAHTQAAIALSRTDTKTNGCHGGPSASCSTTTTIFFGEAVNNWLNANRDLSFINGPSRDNVHTSSSGGGGGGSICCFSPGTPILMADGTTMAIEDVAAGDEVISVDGRLERRSAQQVNWRIDPNDLLFGINDIAPFFNATHPLRTLEGWKAMAPVAARKINPDLEIGQLQEGDVLLRVASMQPFRYEEVRIDQITRVLAGKAGVAYVHSLHLEEENPGYHAHGFHVAVNYPKLREDHFVQAFAGITPAEREWLRGHFEALAPFLRRGLGNYVGEIFRLALGDPDHAPTVGGPRIQSVTHS